MTNSDDNEPGLERPLDVFAGRAAELFTTNLRSARRSEATDLRSSRYGGSAGTVLDVDVVGPRIRIFRVARPPGLTFEAGQYLKLGMPSVAQRKYTIASAPHEDHLCFCIALVTSGALTPGLFSLHPGSRLELSPRVGGRFVLDDDCRTHLMIATTTGIAPFRSMIRSVLATGVSSGSPGGKRAHRFVVVHGARSVEDLPFFREFEDLARRCEQVSYVPAVTNAAASGMTPWRGRRGRVDAVARDLLGSSIESRELRVYACGNAGMVANVRESFGRLGLDVRHEKFF